MKPLLDPTLNSADASVDHSGGAIPCQNMYRFSATCVMTGSSTGAVKIQVSNDVVNPTEPMGTPANWVDLPSASSTISGAGTTLIASTEICYQYIRAVYTHNNGSAGTITVNIKTIGA